MPMDFSKGFFLLLCGVAFEWVWEIVRFWEADVQIYPSFIYMLQIDV